MGRVRLVLIMAVQYRVAGYGLETVDVLEWQDRTLETRFSIIEKEQNFRAKGRVAGLKTPPQCDTRKT